MIIHVALQEDSEKLRTQHDTVLDRLTESDSKNRELRLSLADTEKQISMLSRQVTTFLSCLFGFIIYTNCVGGCDITSKTLIENF